MMANTKHETAVREAAAALNIAADEARKVGLHVVLNLNPSAGYVSVLISETEKARAAPKPDEKPAAVVTESRGAVVS